MGPKRFNPRSQSRTLGANSMLVRLESLTYGLSPMSDLPDLSTASLISQAPDFRVILNLIVPRRPPPRSIGVVVAVAVSVTPSLVKELELKRPICFKSGRSRP